MDNIFYYPERHGFEMFYTIEGGRSHRFSTTIVLRNVETGKLFYSQDKGCSCPSPFNGVGTPDLEPLVLETFEEFKRDVKEHHEDDGLPPSDYLDCFDKVRKYLDQ